MIMNNSDFFGLWLWWNKWDDFVIVTMLWIISSAIVILMFTTAKWLLLSLFLLGIPFSRVQCSDSLKNSSGNPGFAVNIIRVIYGVFCKVSCSSILTAMAWKSKKKRNHIYGQFICVLGIYMVGSQMGCHIYGDILIYSKTTLLWLKTTSADGRYPTGTSSPVI